MSEQQWQPIETMPQVGPFLVYWAKSITGEPCIDIMAGPEEYRQILMYGEPPATHWMPLPEPPQ